MDNSKYTCHPRHRGFLQSILDRFFAWLLGFPPERCSYTTTNVRIPVSIGLDRVDLASDLLRPQRKNDEKPLGTLLVRSPYGRGWPVVIITRTYAARGYQVLLVSSRGTFGSGGEFDAFRDEVEDGKGVVEWMRKQAWYSGTFATLGGSYLGFTQWALLCDPPEDLITAVPIVGPHDFSRPAWETGALNLDLIRWGHGVAQQEQYGPLRRALLPARNIEPIIKSVPLVPNVRKFMGNGSPWMDSMMSKSDLSDPHYAPMQLYRSLERVNVPVLVVTGWYDLFLEQTMEQYARLKERKCNVALTVGPWSHIQCAFASKSNQQNFDWIEHFVAGKSEAKRTYTVQYFVTGAEEWRNIMSYPPTTSPRILYLQQGGELVSQPSSAESGYSTFEFDPQHSTPTTGGNGLESGGCVDDTALAKRKDVLVFDTAPLTDELEFCGRPLVEITHSADSPFADIFVRISEVNKKGKSCNITEAYMRLNPERNSNERISLELHPHAHRFLKGTKIRVLIAGGNFPHYARNHGIDNVGNTKTEMRIVKHTIKHDQADVSRVIFPVL
ncbi:X-Pro dipeptidyl-peptidase-domain-containing protein [Pyrenochaeta sp. MPI-SDFR-AT-0127]|nr:X-Pro dipeptidyl-peptidase-domain-containing protein [Pyrenochaeta sp. MPI-SDFR-AT-0127]